MHSYKGIAYDKMAAILLQAVKEQQRVIAVLDSRIEALELKLNGWL